MNNELRKAWIKQMFLLLSWNTIIPGLGFLMDEPMQAVLILTLVGFILLLLISVQLSLLKSIRDGGSVK